MQKPKLKHEKQNPGQDLLRQHMLSPLHSPHFSDTRNINLASQHETESMNHGLLVPRINCSVNLPIIVPPDLPTSTVRITAMTIIDKSPHCIKTDVPVKLEPRVDLEVPKHRIRSSLRRGERSPVVRVVVKPQTQILPIRSSITEILVLGVRAEIVFGREELILKDPGAGVKTILCSVPGLEGGGTGGQMGGDEVALSVGDCRWVVSKDDGRVGWSSVDKGVGVDVDEIDWRPGIERPVNAGHDIFDAFLGWRRVAEGSEQGGSEDGGESNHDE